MGRQSAHREIFWGGPQIQPRLNVTSRVSQGLSTWQEARWVGCLKQALSRLSEHAVRVKNNRWYIVPIACLRDGQSRENEGATSGSGSVQVVGSPPLLSNRATTLRLKPVTLAVGDSAPPQCPARPARDVSQGASRLNDPKKKGPRHRQRSPARPHVGLTARASVPPRDCPHPRPTYLSTTPVARPAPPPLSVLFTKTPATYLHAQPGRRDLVRGLDLNRRELIGGLGMPSDYKHQSASNQHGHT